jgi:hypothetical protein
MAPPEVQETPQSTPRIVAYGDSIAVGINGRSQPGTPPLALGGTGLHNNDLPLPAGIENGDSVIVSVGWNDTGFAAGNPSDYTQRVRVMIQDIKRENGGAPIVLLGLEQGTGYDGGVYSDGTLISGARIRATNAALQAAAEAEGIAFLTPNTAGIAGARSATNRESLHYNPDGYALIRSQASNRLSYAPTTTTPPLNASRDGVSRVETETAADARARNISREQAIRDRYANTDEDLLREFFANLYDNEALTSNPFGLLLLGIIGALLGYDIGANRRAPETGDAVGAEASADGVSPPTTRVERRDRPEVNPSGGPNYVVGSTPNFGAGLQVRRDTIIRDEEIGDIARQTGMSEANVIKAARRSAVALNTMHPQMRAAVTEQVRAMFLAGHPVVVTECFRSNEEQERLYAQGRTTGGDIVTHARGGSSFHNYGLACDIVPVDINGSPVWRTGVNGTSFETIRGYMRNAGVRTIGDWDKPHYEMPISMRALRQLPDRDNDGYRDLPNIPAQWAAANSRAGVSSTAVAGASPSPAAPVSTDSPNILLTALPADVRTAIASSLRGLNTNNDNKITIAEFVSGLSNRQSASNSRPVFAVA